GIPRLRAAQRGAAPPRRRPGCQELAPPCTAWPGKRCGADAVIYAARRPRQLRSREGSHQMNSHPLLQRLRPPFATRPIERMATAIVSAIEAEYRGIVVYGLGRFGKSCAVEYLSGNATWFPEPFFSERINVPKSHKRTDGAFYSLWLERLGMTLPERTSSLARMARLRNLLIDRQS